MIKITIKKEDGRYKTITVKGHSGYDIEGRDIVCAGVSTIVVTSVNAIMRMQDDAISYNQDEGLVEVNVLKQTNEVTILLENMIDLLKQLQEQYKKYIKIYE